MSTPIDAAVDGEARVGIDDAARELLVQALRDTDAPCGAVAVVDADRTIRIVAHRGLDDADGSTPALSLSSSSPLTDAIRDRVTVLVDDRIVRPYAGAPERAAVAAVPLVVGDRTIGGFFVASRDRRRFSDDDRARLTLLAASSSNVIELARLFDAERSARRRAERAAALHRELQQLITGLSGAASEEEVARIVVAHGAAALELRNGAMWRRRGDELVLVESVGYPEAHLRAFSRVAIADPDSPLALAVRESTPVWIASRAEYAARFPNVEAIHRGVVPTRLAFACMPLLLEDAAIGAVAFTWNGEHVFDDEERRFLTLLVHQCAQTLDRARLLRDLRATGARYRRIFDSNMTAIARWEGDALVEANESMMNLVGRAIGDPPLRMETITPREYVEADMRARREVIERGHCTPYEKELVRADGERVPVLIGAATWEGQNDAGILFALDITDRHRIENARRFLAAAGTELASTIHIDETIRRVVELAVPAHADWCFVDLVDGASVRRIAVSHADPSKDGVAAALKRTYAIDHHGIGISGAITRGVTQRRTGVDEAHLREIARDDAHLAAMRHMDIRSYVSAPLLARGRSIGVLTFVSSRRDYDDVAAWLAGELARAAGVALDNARLFAATREAHALAERERERLERLRRVTTALAAARSATDVANALVRAVVEAVSARAAVVYALTDDGSTLEAVHTEGVDEATRNAVTKLAADASSATAETARTGAPLFLSNRAAYEGHFSNEWIDRDEAIVALPLLSESRAIGAAVFACGTPREFDERQRELLAAIAAPCGPAFERARLRDRVDASERKYRQIVETANEGVWIVDTSRRTSFVNRRMAEMLGYDVEAMIGRDVASFVATAAPSDIFAGAVASTLASFDAPLRRADGSTLWTHVSASPLLDDDDDVVGSLALVSDVSARRRAESDQAFLARATEQLGGSLDFGATLQTLAASAIPTLGDGCVVVPLAGDLDGAIAAAHHDANRADRLRDLVREHLAELRVDDARIVAGDASFAFLDAASIVLAPLHARDHVLGLAAFVHDVSGRRHDRDDLSLAVELARRASVALDNARLFVGERQARRDADLARTHAEDALRVRDNFLSIASHELRTPITGLTLQIQSLVRQIGRSGFSTERVLPRLQSAAEQVGRLTTLVDDLLDVSRLTAGRMRLELVDVDLPRVVRDVTARFDDQLRESGCRVTLDLDDPAVVVADRQRVDQVVTNLLTNAMKYGRGKPIEIVVHLHDDRALLHVRDEGIGIPAASQARIFDRFERVSENPSISGFGLGLWIVKNLLELMHGDISVESEPGRGSTFSVRLPIARP